MSLTLLYRGKNVRFSLKLNKARWVSAMLAFALISGYIVYLFLSANDRPAQVTNSSNPSLSAAITQSEPRTHLINVNEEISSATISNQALLEESQSARSKLAITAITIKLAELQSNILRLNALGDRLAREADIPEKEFNFTELPPTGGPSHNVSMDSEQIKSFSELLLELSTVEYQLEKQEKQLKLLESLTLGHHIQESGYLSGRPIKKGWLSSYYGIRKDPFNGRPAMHKGVDFAGKEDAAIIATASGVISWAGTRYGYGNLIEINHGEGLKTRYGHNKALLVNVGDVVEKGQVIARMGSTGRSTGPHVHYEILKNNTQINPVKYVYRKAK